jgi:hypothetical protein
MALACLNCSAVVAPEDGKEFGGVFCCPTCHLLATRLYERGSRELKQLLILMHESIRVALVEGRLQFGESQLGELSKADLLAQIGQLVEERRAKPPGPT